MLAVGSFFVTKVTMCKSAHTHISYIFLWTTRRLKGAIVCFVRSLSDTCWYAFTDMVVLFLVLDAKDTKLSENMPPSRHILPCIPFSINHGSKYLHHESHITQCSPRTSFPYSRLTSSHRELEPTSPHPSPSQQKQIHVCHPHSPASLHPFRSIYNQQHQQHRHLEPRFPSCTTPSAPVADLPPQVRCCNRCF